MHLKSDYSINHYRKEAVDLPTKQEPVRLKGGYRKTSGARQGSGCVAPAPDLGSYRLTHTNKVDSPFTSLRDLLREIRYHPILRSYWKLCWSFTKYLNQMDKACFIVSGFDQLKNKSALNVGKYIHRWTPIYQQRLMAKLYQLDEWWKEHKGPVTLLTLTTYQAGEYSQYVKGEIVTIEDSFLLLKDGWDKLSKILRKYIPDLTYIWVIEPHKSGYPHMHILVFAEISQLLQDKIKQLWSEKYKAGSKEHGVDFTTRIPEEDINSLRNYLMKYIAKGFVITNTKFSETLWTKEQLVFNALIWKKGYRTFQPSRNLQKIMHYDKANDENSVWWHTGESEFESMSTSERERHLIWERLKFPIWLPFRELN
jgi:hypothetical protein